MAKFTKKGKKTVGAVSTASLPDIVFMLLFFFMVVTVMKEDDPKVNFQRPTASETTILQKKHLVDYIYVGTPIDESLGDQPMIQLDDAFARVEDIQRWVEGNRQGRPENQRGQITTSFKADEDVKMGLLSSIKEELRKSNALKINYSVFNGSEADVLKEK